MRGVEAKLRVQEGAVPFHPKHRIVPFSIRAMVGKEIDNLLADGVLIAVEQSEWATPVVPVVKPTGAIHLRGNFKVTLKPKLVVDLYPMPSIEDLQEQMSGGTLFSKLDLSWAFSQIKLADDSKPLAKITTYKGLFQYNRLPYGVASAPVIHQRAMDGLLRDIPGVLCYQDDIFITGKDQDDHLRTHHSVLSKLQGHRLRLNKDTCTLLQTSIVYLGHRIDKDGIHPTADKVEVVQEAPSPSNVSELCSFIGLINYYQRFLPDLASHLHPLHQLLNKQTPWERSSDCEKSFLTVKQMLSTDCVLTPYNIEKPLILACDASAYGLGAVLSHILPDGQERPVASASRTLSAREKNHAQMAREALSIIFCVMKFYIYLYGRPFTLLTDHKLHTTILGPKTGAPPIAPMRMQRQAAILTAYNYEIKYKCSRDHANADAMSRLPQPCRHVPSEQVKLLHVHHLASLPVTLSQVHWEVETDTVLSQAYHSTVEGRAHSVSRN